MRQKIVYTLIALGLSLATIIFAWSPSLVTYIPLEQQYEFTAEQSIFINNTTSQHREAQLQNLKVVTILIAVSFLLTTHLIWRRKA